MNLSKKEHSYLTPSALEAALNQVRNYVEKEGADWKRVIDTEVEISHVEADYILNGKIDLLRGEGDSVEIVDFKAEKKPDMEIEREKIERYRRQLQFYAYIVEQKLGLKVDKMHIYYTAEEDGIPTITYKNQLSDMTETIKAIDRTIRKIECKDLSSRSSSQKLCRECDLRYYCGRQ